MINKWKFFIHRVHVNLEREAYREKEGERFSEFTWNLWTKNFHLLIKCYKTWMKKYDPFFETLPSCIFWIKIISFEIIAIFHRTVGDEPGIAIDVNIMFGISKQPLNWWIVFIYISSITVGTILSKICRYFDSATLLIGGLFPDQTGSQALRTSFPQKQCFP